MSEWSWYYSTDGGERCYGPCASREEAIAEGRENTDDSFVILEARKGKLYTALFNDLAERLDDLNDDAGDPEGDPISTEFTDAQWLDLEKRLNAATAEWAEANNLHGHVWLFAATRNQEDIVPEPQP